LSPLGIRPLKKRDLKALPQVLGAAFSSYHDANRYHPALLSFFYDWMWGTGPALVLASENEIYGALLGGFRQAEFQGEPLKVLHVGPAGIVPRHRRKGHGTEMLRQLTHAARQADVDMMSLTTEVAYGAHRLYRRAGFDVVEAYRPIVRRVDPERENSMACAGLQVVDGFAVVGNSTPSKPGIIWETGPASPPLPKRLRPRSFQLAGGTARSLQWSVISRDGGREQAVKVTQLVEWRPGESPESLLAAVCAMAAQDKSLCVFALPSTVKSLPDFDAKGGPLVYRMARGLTEKGAQAVNQAEGYSECCPAP
jgi:GNAT superfamily N-acetyltransferase